MKTKYKYLDELSEEQIAEFKLDSLQQQEVKPVHPGLAGAGKRRETIIAEGDSWFDFLPGLDIIYCLRNNHGYRIENFSKAGDTLENMIFGNGYKDNFERIPASLQTVLQAVIRYKSRILLFSGGGNDVAGDEFKTFLNHKSTGLPPFKNDYAHYMINTIFREYLVYLIGQVKQKAPGTHIVMHGYGKPIPSGKGVNFLFFTFAGPWLKPAFVMKNIMDVQEQKQITAHMIDTYNDMLAGLDSEHDNFHYVNLRPHISQNDWRDELHLKNSAFATSAEVIHNRIRQIIDQE